MLVTLIECTAMTAVTVPFLRFVLRDNHRRIVPPAIVADVPNLTFDSGGLL